MVERGEGTGNQHCQPTQLFSSKERTANCKERRETCGQTNFSFSRLLTLEMKIIAHRSSSVFQKCAAWPFPELCIIPLDKMIEISII